MQPTIDTVNPAAAAPSVASAARETAHRPKSKHPGRPPALPLAQWMLVVALALTTFEGAIRKWTLGGEKSTLSYLVYFSKDLVFAALFFCAVRAAVSTAEKLFRRWLLVGVMLMLLGAVCSSALRSFNPVGALLTLRATVFLPVIALYSLRRLAGARVVSFATLLVAFTIFNFALGTIQNRLSSDHWLNHYAETEMFVVEEDSGVRATGTFAYITGLSILAGIGIWAGLTLLSARRKAFLTGVTWVGIMAGFGCGLASISRTPILGGILLVATWALFARKSVTMTVQVLLGCLVAAVLAIGFYSTLAPLLQGFFTRSTNAGDSIDDRMFGQFSDVWMAINVVPFGNGFGSEQVASNYYLSGVAGFTNFEGQLPRLVAEAGILGLVGFLVVSTGSVLALERVAWETKQAGGKTVIRVTQVWLVSMFYNNVAFNHTTSAYVCIIFALVSAAYSTNQPRRVPVARKAALPSRPVLAPANVPG